MAAQKPPRPCETDEAQLEILLRKRAERIRRRQLDTAYRRLRTSDEPIPAEVAGLLDGVSRTLVEELVAALLGEDWASNRDAKPLTATSGSDRELIRGAFELFEFDDVPTQSADIDARPCDVDPDVGSHAD